MFANPVPVGTVYFPVIMNDIAASEDLDTVLAGLYENYAHPRNAGVSQIIPQSLSSFFRSCLWNSGNSSTEFVYRMEITSLEAVDDPEVARKIMAIKTGQSMEEVLFGGRNQYRYLPSARGRLALHHVAENWCTPVSTLKPFIMTVRIMIPRRLITGNKVWKCMECIRSCLEKLICASVPSETLQNIHGMYARMTRAMTAYNNSASAPTLSQKFLLAVSRNTESMDHDFDQPEGLAITLRPHQRRSLKFCLNREREAPERLGVCIGEWDGQNIYYSPILKFFSFEPIESVRSSMLLDEMGLGKTAVTLALHLSNPRPSNMNHGGTLVVCPPALIHQWVAEAKKTLTDEIGNEMYIFHGPRRIRDVDFLRRQSMVVTTYGIIKSENNSAVAVANSSRELAGTAQQQQSPLAQIHWHRIVFDESHLVRNSNTVTYRVCKKLTATHWLFASGTPFVSKIDDIPSQINLMTRYNVSFRCSDYYGSLKRFIYILLQIAVRNTTTMRINNVPLLDLQAVRNERVPLRWDTEEEEARYREEEAIIYHNIRMMSTGVALSQVAKLQRRCALGFGRSIVFDRQQFLNGFMTMTEEEVRIASEHDGDCPICMEPIEPESLCIVRSCKHIFCSVCIQTCLQHGASACPLCRGNLNHRNICVQPPNNDEEENARRQRQGIRNAKSPKLEKLMQLIEASTAEDKFIVFSNFKDMIFLTKSRLDAENISSVAFLPGVSLQRRRKGLEQFQEDASLKVLLLPMRTSSSGLTVTAANRIVFMEPALHRSSERQAIGRAWRMGQQRQVTVHHLYMTGTAEEKIFSMNRTTGVQHAAYNVAPERMDSRWNYDRVLQLFQ